MEAGRPELPGPGDVGAAGTPGGGGAPGAGGSVHLDWHLEIFGYRPRPANIEALPRGAFARAWRAVAAFVVGCTIAPVMIMMPPHMEPAVITVFIGAYIARSYWRGLYVVRSFTGSCPRCGAALRLRRGTLLRVPHGVSCRSCRDTPRLLPGPADDAVSGVITPGGKVLSPEELRAADAAWRRRRARLTPSVWNPSSGDWAELHGRGQASTGDPQTDGPER